MSDELLDVKQVQARLRVSERTVFRLIAEGRLQGFKAGREWRFEEKDIQAYQELERREAKEKRLEKLQKRNEKAVA